MIDKILSILNVSSKPIKPSIFKRSDPYSHSTITQDEAQWIIAHASCPDCGHPLIKGPEGGCSVNAPCTNPECGSEFNLCPSMMAFSDRNGKMDQRRRQFFGIADSKAVSSIGKNGVS